MGLEILSHLEIIEIMENYISKHRPPEHLREEIDLTGFWKFQIDSDSIGNKEKWYLPTHLLSDSIKLPGTTDLSNKGFFNTDTLTSRLHRN